MRILVTGGAGFIGSHIVERLLHLNHTVSVIDNFSTGKRENIRNVVNEITLHEGDIRDTVLLNDIIHGIDVVIHQAALSSVPQSIADPIGTNDINVNGTLKILQTAKDLEVKKIIFASSAAIYGDDPELPKHEQMKPYPLSPYAISKLIGEYYCKVFSGLYGLKTVSLRYFNVFGPRQDPKSEYAAVIPKFIQSMLKDEKPVIYGDGFQSRDFIFIDSVVDANIKAMFCECESGLVMNCASGVKTTINDLVGSVNDIIKKNIKPIYQESRPGDIKHSYADISLIKGKLNFGEIINFKDGLKKTIKYWTEELT
ncbi:MAG: Vi polysaccharide biosynthesis protein VipB/TviC [Ignavibacteria bacterium RBG_13_36_8]|nr:MAG: Vi polysaccharide biosynthesis protein VipB/TviC [Ignavibacteria bacterium RBG_13_36_8]